MSQELIEFFFLYVSTWDAILPVHNYGMREPIKVYIVSCKMKKNTDMICLGFLL